MNLKARSIASLFSKYKVIRGSCAAINFYEYKKLYSFLGPEKYLVYATSLDQYYIPNYYPPYINYTGIDRVKRRSPLEYITIGWIAHYSDGTQIDFSNAT